MFFFLKNNEVLHLSFRIITAFKENAGQPVTMTVIRGLQLFLFPFLAEDRSVLIFFLLMQLAPSFPSSHWWVITVKHSRTSVEGNSWTNVRFCTFWHVFTCTCILYIFLKFSYFLPLSQVFYYHSKEDGHEPCYQANKEQWSQQTCDCWL